MTSNFFEIDESDSRYNIENLKINTPAFLEIYMKNLIIYQERADFWKSRIDIGKKCMDYRRRNIFTPSDRSNYRSMGKTPVEPQIMKNPINATVEQVKNGVRSSIITYEDDSPPENAASPEVVNVVLKHWESDSQLKIERTKNNIRTDALITGFPTWAWFDKEYLIDGIHTKIIVYNPKWDTMLPELWYDKPDGGDINDVCKISRMTKAELFEIYPDRIKEYKKFDPNKDWDPGNISQIMHNTPYKDAYDRTDLIFETINQASNQTFEADSGHYTLVERFFQVKYDRELMIRPEPFDIVEIPSDWDQKRIERWRNDNPEYTTKRTENVKTLWVTAFTTNGFVWENGQHWYQEDGKLPGRAYIPDSIDGLPTGQGEDMLSYVITIAGSKTEGFHQVKVGTGSLLHTVAGATMDVGTIKKEMSSPNGVLVYDPKIVQKMGGIKNLLFTEKKVPNTTFLEFADRERDELERDVGPNKATIGATSERQSNKAKLTEIVQGATTQAPYIRNYSYFELDLRNILLKMIPYEFTENAIIEINDDYGQNRQQVEINQGGFDYSGEAVTLANDLVHTRYKAVPVLVDDSSTSKEREQREFNEYMERVGIGLLQTNPRFLGSYLKSLDNRYAKSFATDLLKQTEAVEQQSAQQQQVEDQKEIAIEKGRRDVDYAKIAAPKKDISAKLSPEEVAANPVASQAILDVMKVP